MARTPDGEQALAENVHARLSAVDKATLDKLVEKRGAELAAQGISGQGTFGAWLRAMIYREAKAEGISTDPPAAPPGATAKAPPKGARKTAKK
jgi:hypothetical protein